MKKGTRFAVSFAACLLLCIGAAWALTVYFHPMENSVYDLSLFWEGEALPEDWVYDQKGWRVFVQDGEEARDLEPDGLGGFSGLSRPGQTFYFSRVMEEDLDSPTLRLGAADRTFSVFLDGVLVYTDCPELDNRIGYLQLPCLDYDRVEPLLVTLPLDYAGKTLTIAQSTEPDASSQVYPCSVTLYCGYTYESALISESFQTAVPSALAFAAGAALLILFLYRSARGKPDPMFVFGAFAAFLYEFSRMASPSFSFAYFDTAPVDVQGLCRQLAVLALTGVLLCRLTGKRRILLRAVLVGTGASMLAEFGLSLGGRGVTVFADAFALLSLAGLLAGLAGGFCEWKRGSWFYRVFCPLTTAGISLAVLATAVSACMSGAWFATLRQQASLGSFGYFLWLLADLTMIPAFFGAVAEFAHDELAARTEARLLAQRSEMTLSSYESLRQQNEQIMMLRHDMVKHFQLLRQMTGEEKVADYLDRLIGQNEKIRPVIQSGNQMLDILLNSKLSAAVDQGIAVEIIRSQAPEQIPLSDMEFCSLVMNLMDNALEAASASGAEHPYIKLDLCQKDSFFVFSCENSSTLDWATRKTAPGHGLGLKIIGQIAAQHDDLLEAEIGADFYRVTLAIPLD